MSEEVRLQELIAQKDARIRQLEADNERQSQEIKLLKEKVDLLIRRLFGAKSEKLDGFRLTNHTVGAEGAGFDWLAISGRTTPPALVR